MLIAERMGFSLAIVLVLGIPLSLEAADLVGKQPTAVPAEEYPLYDLVVRDKFLTSRTTMVVIERLTVSQAEKNEREYLSRESLEEEEIFENRLPPVLLDDFLFKLKAPSRLDGKFNFGVPYRFVRGGVPEEPEVSLAPIPAANRRRIQAPRSTIGLLRFSRVGFTRREDQALVYVEEERLDGTGGGFLVWLNRRGRVWTIADTEVLWMAQSGEPSAGP
ncbi:MAG: hypothetical protein EXR96_04290 [Nitrospiraceae bacterium]|nr:hypothetical protein [Nitrospiraceae bacterium]